MTVLTLLDMVKCFWLAALYLRFEAHGLEAPPQAVPHLYLLDTSPISNLHPHFRQRCSDISEMKSSLVSTTRDLLPYHAFKP